MKHKKPKEHRLRRPPKIEPIDPHRKEQHRPSGDSPDREDEDLKVAQKQRDPIANVEMTKAGGITPQRGQPGESAGGGFEEGPVNSRTSNDAEKEK